MTKVKPKTNCKFLTLASFLAKQNQDWQYHNRKNRGFIPMQLEALIPKHFLLIGVK